MTHQTADPATPSADALETHLPLAQSVFFETTVQIERFFYDHRRRALIETIASERQVYTSSTVLRQSIRPK